MLIFGSFYSSENPEKMYTVLNMADNNTKKSFLDSKSAY